MELQRRYDAVVIGGGHNGLVAAGYLAGAGQKVLLLESNDALGGATTAARVFEGMDARLSRYSYLISLFPQAIVDDLGLTFSTRRRAIASCTPYQRGPPDALVLSNVDPERSRASFCSLAGQADWRGYQSLRELELTLAARIWPSLLEPLRSREQWTASLSTPAEREAWDALVEQPLGEVIERSIQNDLVRGILLTDAKVGIFVHPHDESLLQNRCFLLHVIGRGTGEWRVPVGGMGALVDALVTAARAGGVKLVTGAAAEAVHPAGKLHTVVFRHDDRVRSVQATRVLVNAGPQVFARLLGIPYTPSPADEGSVCKVNVLLHRLPRLKAQHVDPGDAFTGTFHLDESYSQLEISYRQADAGVIPGRPPADIYCHTLTDDSILGPELRGAGYHTLTLFGLDMPYRLFKSDHEAVKEEVLLRYLRGLDRVLAEPIEDCVARDANGDLCIEIKSPLDLECELALNRGNIFHSALSWFFVDDPDLVGTWGVETPFERIYRCGSSALRGGAVSGIPGRNTARRIFDELRISRPPVHS